MNIESKPSIVIAGGGFGGIRAALDVSRALGRRAKVTLIDKNASHLFVPELYEVAAALAVPDDPYALTLRHTLCIPYTDIFAQHPVEFVQAEIADIDLDRQAVMTRGGAAVAYDYLVIALGSQPADFGIPGVPEYAYQFKTMDDALLINRRIHELMQNIKSGVRQAPLKIFIGGAGFTGIETAAELALCMRRLARAARIHGKPVLVYLFEAGPKILPTISERERALIRERLTRLGVIVMEQAAIEEVGDGLIKLKDGHTMRGDMVIWTAGIEAHRMIRAVKGLELTPRGKIIVGEHLHLPTRNNVFAVGDNIEFVDHATQKPIPSLAYLAIDHGRVAASNIVRSLYGKELMVHKPFYDIWVAPVGGKYAVAHLWRGIVFKGLLGWIVRELVNLRYFFSLLPIRSAVRFYWREMKVFLRND